MLKAIRNPACSLSQGFVCRNTAELVRWTKTEIYCRKKHPQPTVSTMIVAALGLWNAFHKQGYEAGESSCWWWKDLNTG